MTCSGGVWTAWPAALAATFFVLLSGCAERPPKAVDTKPAGAVKLTADGFDEATAGGVALVDFWAEWCLPCRKQGPIVDKLAVEYQGRALVGKVNADEERELVARFGIGGIPSLILLKDGEESRRVVGLISEEDLRFLLEEALGEE